MEKIYQHWMDNSYFRQHGLKKNSADIITEMFLEIFGEIYFFTFLKIFSHQIIAYNRAFAPHRSIKKSILG